MRNEDLMRIVRDPDLSDPDTARVLIQLARQAARSDEDIAGDVLVALTDKLRDGGTLRGRLTSHANPPALLARAAANAARDAWDHASRFKRDLPLTPDGDLTALESPDRASSPTFGLLDLLEDLGWTVPHLEMLALPRKRPGRSVHPGIEDGLERLASCFGITKRCPGCTTEDDLLRVDLRGPSSWPHLVPVLREWGWSDDPIDYVTTSPSNIAHWQTLDLRPPPARNDAWSRSSAKCASNRGSCATPTPSASPSAPPAAAHHAHRSPRPADGGNAQWRRKREVPTR